MDHLDVTLIKMLVSSFFFLNLSSKSLRVQPQNVVALLLYCRFKLLG